MDAGNPIVSVLITVYNREKYLSDAIESVLNSTFRDFEIIIVDDCSSDKSVEIAKHYQQIDKRIILHINKKNLGDYPNRNVAASYASGKYIKYVDSDDKIFPNSLGIMVEGMEKNPEAGFAVSTEMESQSLLFTSEEAYKTHFFKRRLLDFGPTGTIIHRDRFFECGRFKEIRNVSDFDFWLRIAMKYPVLELPGKLIFWREHSEQEIKIAPELYLENMLPIITENLSHKDCPLNNEEKRIIIKKYRKITSRSLLKEAIYKSKISLSYRMWKNLNLNISDLF